MEYTDISAGLLNAAKLELLAELDHCILKVNDELLRLRLLHVELESEEVSLDVLVLADLRVHETQLGQLLVFEIDRICSYLLDVLVLGEEVEEDKHFALDEADPFEVVIVVAFDAIRDDVDADEVMEEREEVEALEEATPADGVGRVPDQLLLLVRSATLLTLRRHLLQDLVAALQLVDKRVKGRLLDSLCRVLQLIVRTQHSHQVTLGIIECSLPRRQVLALLDMDGNRLLPVRARVDLEELVNEIGDVVVGVVLVDLGDHYRATDASQVPKHGRVDAASLRPELDHSKEVAVDAIIGYVLLDVGIAQVAIETLLCYRAQPHEGLLVHDELLDVILTVDILAFD